MKPIAERLILAKEIVEKEVPQSRMSGTHRMRTNWKQRHTA
jgi:hypothetical protein